MLIDTTLIFENVPIPLFYKDDANNILRVNKEFLKVFGYKREDVEGKNCYDLYGQELGKRYHDDDLEVINSGEVKRGIIEPAEVPTGNIMCRTDKVPHYDDEGNVIGIIGFTLDITKELDTQQELANLKQAIEQSPSTVVITDLSGKIKYVNPKFSEVTGYHYKEVIERNPRLLKSGKLSDEQYKKMWDEISSGKVWRGEFLNKTKEGKLYWEIASIAPVRDKDGRITNYIKVAEVITDLRETMINLWNVLDFASYFVIVLNKDMVVRLCNKALARFLGYEDEHDLVGKSWIEFIPPKEQELITHVHHEVLHGEGERYQEATTELISGEGIVVPVKWFNSNINHKYHMTFSLGTPVMSDLYKNNLENTREFFERILRKDKMTIKAIKNRIKKDNGE